MGVRVEGMTLMDLSVGTRNKLGVIKPNISCPTSMDLSAVVGISSKGIRVPSMGLESLARS